MGLLTAIWNHMEVIWKSYGSPKPPKMVTRLVLEAYGTHMEIHMEIIFPCLMSLTSIWNHMEVIWKSYGSPKQNKCYYSRSGSIWNPYGNPYGNHISMSYVTTFDLEPYGSHMEVIWKSQTKKNVTRLVLEAYETHMEIHMEIIFPCLMLLTSFWNHMEPIWKSIWKSYFHVLCY